MIVQITYIKRLNTKERGDSFGLKNSLVTPTKNYKLIIEFWLEIWDYVHLSD